MRKFSKIRKFFWPPLDAPLPLRIAPYASLVVLALALLLTMGTLAGWNYTNSLGFLRHDLPHHAAAVRARSCVHLTHG